METNNQVPPPYPYPYPPYPPMPPEYYQKPKKEHKFWKGLLKFLAITSGVIFVLVMLFFFVLKPLADNWLKSVGSSGIFQMLDLYKEVTADVTESEVVNDPFSLRQFDSAKKKITTAGAEIFSTDSDKLDINKISGSLYFDDILLTANEFAAILDSALDDAVLKLNNEVLNKLNVNFDLKQISLDKTELSGKYNLSIIAYANLTSLGDQMGVIGVLVPAHVYLNFTSVISINEFGEMTFENNAIKVNKISDKSLKELFSIIAKVLFPEKPAGDKSLLEETADFLASILNDGFVALHTNLNIDVAPVLDADNNPVLKFSTRNEKPEQPNIPAVVLK